MRKILMTNLFVLFTFATTLNMGCSSGYSNILNMLSNKGNLDTILSLVDAAGGLDNVLGGLKNFTMLAPSDDAFSKLGSDVLSSLTDPSNKDKLIGTLQNHILPGKMDLSGIADMGDNIASMGGKDLNITGSGDDLKVGGANVLETVKAGKGIIHVIDKVL